MIVNDITTRSVWIYIKIYQSWKNIFDLYNFNLVIVISKVFKKFRWKTRISPKRRRKRRSFRRMGRSLISRVSRVFWSYRAKSFMKSSKLLLKSTKVQCSQRRRMNTMSRRICISMCYTIKERSHISFSLRLGVVLGRSVAVVLSV